MESTTILTFDRRVDELYDIGRWTQDSSSQPITLQLPMTASVARSIRKAGTNSSKTSVLMRLRCDVAIMGMTSSERDVRVAHIGQMQSDCRISRIWYTICLAESNGSFFTSGIPVYEEETGVAPSDACLEIPLKLSDIDQMITVFEMIGSHTDPEPIQYFPYPAMATLENRKTEEEGDPLFHLILRPE